MPEPTGTGKCNGEMIRWLSANGYECTVITSYPHYPQWKVQPPYTRKRYWYSRELSADGRARIYRCPQYVPGNPSGKRRVLMDFSFACAAFLRMLPLLVSRKYDIVITVAPPFHLGLMGVLYKKLRGARFFYHIQDLQIEAARDLGMISSAAFIRLLFSIEGYILRQADQVSSISEGMIQRIRAKAGKEIFFFPNWTDVSTFYPLEDREQLKKAYGFAATDRVILYAGAIGEKQGLETILHAASVMKGSPSLRFLICGAGPYKKQLQDRAVTMQLENVFFPETQPFEQFNRFLNMADVHLVIQKSGAGDLVMPSKLTTILAVGGLALVTANEGTSLHTLIKEHEIGIVIASDDQQALAEGIVRAIEKRQEHITSNARQYALEYLALDKVMMRFSSTLREST